MFCPLISFRKEYAREIPCMGEECAFHSYRGCLIAGALGKYIDSTPTSQPAREDPFMPYDEWWDRAR